MSKTGVYRFNPITQEMEKVSDQIPHVSFVDSASVPGGGYFSENMGVHINSRRQKIQEMERRGIREKVRKLKTVREL